jgi:undecaprenyl-diphosphatase
MQDVGVIVSRLKIPIISRRREIPREGGAGGRSPSSRQAQPGSAPADRGRDSGDSAIQGEGAAAPAARQAKRAALWLLLGIAAFVLAGWAIGEVWISAIGSTEQDAMETLATGRTEPWITLARVITWAGSAFVLVPLAVVCCLLLARVGRRRPALAVALSLAGGVLIASLVKQLTSRPRPVVVHLQAVTGSSFPSGHSTQAAAFWVALALALRCAPFSRSVARVSAIGALLLTLGVAWSRVYLGVHYPSDVVAGLLLGGSWAVFVAYVLHAPAQPLPDGAVAAPVTQTG